MKLELERFTYQRMEIFKDDSITLNKNSFFISTIDFSIKTVIAQEKIIFIFIPEYVFSQF